MNLTPGWAFSQLDIHSRINVCCMEFRKSGLKEILRHLLRSKITWVFAKTPGISATYSSCVSVKKFMLCQTKKFALVVIVK